MRHSLRTMCGSARRGNDGGERDAASAANRFRVVWSSLEDNMRSKNVTTRTAVRKVKCQTVIAAGRQEAGDATGGSTRAQAPIYAHSLLLCRCLATALRRQSATPLQIITDGLVKIKTFYQLSFREPSSKSLSMEIVGSSRRFMVPLLSFAKRFTQPQTACDYSALQLHVTHSQ